MKTADVIVIGGGIAGASAAAEIAADGAQVLLLEMESQPGYHATGRSAAMYEPCEGVALVRALTRASYGFFSSPPDGFVDVPLLSPRGVLMLGYEGDERLIADARRNGFAEVDAGFARSKLPLVKLDGAIAVLWDGQAQDIDVDALHGGRLRALRRAKGEVVADAAVRRGTRIRDIWRLEAGRRSMRSADGCRGRGRLERSGCRLLRRGAGRFAAEAAQRGGSGGPGRHVSRRLAGDLAGRRQLLCQADGRKADAVAGG